MPPHVRPVHPADIDAILALECATPEAPHWTSEDYQRIVNAAPLATFDPTTMQRAAFVAEDSGSVAGFAVVRLVAGIAELESIAVSAPQRRRGVGTALVAAVMAWSRDRQSLRLTLEVRSANHAAIALYTHFGFKIDGRRPRYYSHPPDDAVLMGLDL